MFDLVKISTCYLFLFYCFKGQFLKNKTFKNFSRLFHCSVINVLCFVVVFLFTRRNFYRISHLSMFVNNFFIFLFCHYFVMKLSAGHPWKFPSLVRDSLYRLPPIFENVKYFFSSFSLEILKRRKRDLNPRAA